MSGNRITNYLIHLIRRPQKHINQSSKIAIKCLKFHRARRDVPSFLVAWSIPGVILAKAWFSKDAKGNSKIIKEADSFYDGGQYEKLLQHLSRHRESIDPEILWRLARALYENCRDIKDDKGKLEVSEDALKLVDKALEIDEKCWAAHKWRAILLDHVWKYKSTKGRIIHSFEIKKHMQRAIELNPSDSTSYYILGEWCFTFADMPWYQRKIAATIFASPPMSTYEEALEHFLKAEQITPMFYSMNLMMIGKCLLKMDQKEKAIPYLKQAKDYPIKTADDKTAHEEAINLLKDIKA